MNARRVSAAVGVICAAQKIRDTAAGIAAALEAAGLLQSPESAAELVALRTDRDGFRDQRNSVFATNEELLVRVERAGLEQLQVQNENRTLLRRVAELEDARDDFLSFTSRLDAKSLDNFLGELSRATEYEPMDGAAGEIELTVTRWRELVESRPTPGALAEQLADEKPVTVRLASEESSDKLRTLLARQPEATP